MIHERTSNVYLTSNKLIYNTILFFISISFSLLLAFLPVDQLVDRINYLVYAEQSDAILDRYLTSGIGAVIFNEPIWLLVNIGLSYFFTPEQTLRYIILFSSFFTFYLTLKSNKGHFFFIIAILLLPQVLKNNLIHIRQGLAIAIFLMGWFSGKHNVRFICIGISCLIHSSFIFIFLLYFMHYFFEKLRFSFEIKAISFLSVGLALGIGGIWIASMLGARQGAEYSGEQAEISGLGFMLWAFILAIFLTSKKKFIQLHTFEIAVIILYLTTYFFLPVTARVLESALIPVLLSARYLSPPLKTIFNFVFLFYFFMQWIIKFGSPGLGWFIT